MSEELKERVAPISDNVVIARPIHHHKGLAHHMSEDVAPLSTSEETGMAPDETEVLTKIIGDLSKLDRDTRIRLLNTVATFFDFGGTFRRTSLSTEPITETKSGRTTDFSTQNELSPKEFLLQKQPKTDLERVACLGFYLTYYREQPHFKTSDITNLNREAAHSPFSNAANAVGNATVHGYLVAAGKGAKQLSAVGEQYVQALPDREAAKAVLARLKPRRGTSKKSRETKTNVKKISISYPG